MINRKSKVYPLILFIVFIQIFLLHLPQFVVAQNPETYRIETVDGNVFIGIIISENDEQIILKTEEFGEINIQKINIKRRELVDPERIIKGSYWFENPYSTRYLFTTSAIGLKSGQGYYQNAWIFFNNVNIGFSNNISLGAGIVPTFLLGVPETPIWFLPKVSIPVNKNNLHLAAGAMLGGLVGGDRYGLGVVYGVMTVGSIDKNLSFGMGYGYAGNDWSNRPLFNFSGLLRTSRTVYLITENYFFSAVDNFTGVISVGIRWAPETLAVDFGLFRPLENVEIIAIPWLGVAIPFGR